MATDDTIKMEIRWIDLSLMVVVTVCNNNSGPGCSVMAPSSRSYGFETTPWGDLMLSAVRKNFDFILQHTE